MSLAAVNNERGQENGLSDPNHGLCQVCAVPAALRCSACFLVFYCQQEHQKSDWKAHKKICAKPFQIKDDEIVGRYMVAARDLQAGQVILREKPCLLGPNLEESDLICVVCYRVLTPRGFLTCKLCQVPVCSVQCSQSESHREGECGVLKQKPLGFYSTWTNRELVHRSSPSAEHANFQLIIPLRALLLKKRDVQQYKKFMALESHVSAREGTQAEVNTDERVCRLLDQFRMHEAANRDLVQKICGIFDTNSFDLAIQGGGRGITGLYLNAAMMMHSCVKNTRLVFSHDHVMTIYAREPIHKGDPIHHSYTRVLAPTTLRRTLLFVGKHFSCECVRCKDPTEMGSLASAWLCPNSGCGPEGVVLSETPLDLSAPWTCRHCSETPYSVSEILLTERRLRMEMDRLKPLACVPAWEDFLERHASLLHPQHALLVEAKQTLSVGYGRFQGHFYAQLTPSQVQRKVQLCREVLATLRLLESGLAAEIGLATYELAFALIRWVQCQSTPSGSEHADEIVALLMESVSVFSYEPPDSHCGILGQTARKELANWEKTRHKDPLTAIRPTA
eukprot:maker-scaffold394_size185225-snap-gene-0.22 protein:Tk12266 transcript:maker-scaffold394_size185225-snap-gene-0.22-mRNA-1 annotation:"hypothetical protein DAPPUDRAFT_2393"